MISSGDLWQAKGERNGGGLNEVRNQGNDHRVLVPARRAECLMWMTGGC